MKKYFLLALILTIAVSSFAVRIFLPRVIIQRCGDMNNLAVESPYVTNTGTTHSPNYLLTVENVNTGEVISTATQATATNLRLNRLGNGGTVPYYSAITMNLIAFNGTGWQADDVLRYTLTYTGTPIANTVDSDNTWDFTIPNQLTTLINIQDPVQGVPPLTETTTETYTLNVTGPAGYTVNGQPFPYTMVDDNDDVNDLIGTVLTPDPTTDGTWNPPTYTVLATDFNAENVATIPFALVPHTYTYILNILGPDGYAVTGPVSGVTDYIATDNDDNVNNLLGTYTIADAPLHNYWVVNPIEVTAANFVLQGPAKGKAIGSRNAGSRTDFVYVATIEFVLAPVIYPTFTVNAFGPAGYTVNGNAFPYTVVDNSLDYTNDLIGMVLTPDPVAGFTWNIASVTVGAGDFMQGVANYTFELVPCDVYTLFVDGPDGLHFTVSGDATVYTFDHTFTDDDCDGINDLLGMVITPDPADAPNGQWNPTSWTNDGTTPPVFDIIPCVNLYSWEIVAYDGYDQSDQTTPLAATIWYCDQLFAVWGDPNYTWVNIGTTPLVVEYPCGLWQLGTYRVSHPGYNDDTWVWNQIVWENIFEDYAYTDWYGFRNETTVPVELSSFTALNVDRNVRLTWVSQTETEMIGYRVLRSNVNDLSSAEAITPTAIAATNTSTTQTYNYTDTEVIENNQYYYWLESVDYNASEFFGPVSVFIEVSAPAVTNVSQIVKSAYPNPFKANSNTTIVVDVKTGETGTVTVYNILGQVVRTFSVNAGTNNVSWNGKDSRGNACGSGIYFYKLSTPSVTDTKKLVIVK